MAKQAQQAQQVQQVQAGMLVQLEPGMAICKDKMVVTLIINTIKRKKKMNSIQLMPNYYLWKL